MGDNSKKPEGRIPASQAPVSTPWNLPRVTGSHVVALERRKKTGQNTDSQLEPRQPRGGFVTPPPPEPKKDVVTLAEAESIREAAYQEGLLQGLTEGREKGYPEGLEQGRSEGSQQGYDEAFKQGQNEIAQAQLNLANIISELQSPLEGQQADLEALVQALVIKLSKAVIKAELTTQPDVILAAVRTALENIPKSESSLQLKVSPADFPHLEAMLPQLGKPIDLKADGAISPGSFELKSPVTLAVSDLAAEFDDLAEQMFQYLTHSSDAEGN
jgi:flagellar assembly protein FliH